MMLSSTRGAIQNYWLPKLKRNADRDAKHLASLAELGWDVLVLWECEVKADNKIADRIREFLECWQA